MIEMRTNTQIGPISSSDSQLDDQSKETHDLPTIAIESERRKAELQATKRMKIFTDIILGVHGENLSLKNMFYPFCYLIITLTLTLPVSAIPFHNLIENPQYFYEQPLQLIHFPVMITAAYLFYCSTWMNIGYIIAWKHFFFISIGGVVTHCICYFFGYLIWTPILQYQIPIPFNNYLFWYIIMISLFTLLYHSFPKGWRRDDAFRTRLRYFMFALIWQMMVIPFLQGILGIVLLMFKDRYQWIFAIFLPLVGDMILWIQLKLAKKACNGDMVAMDINCQYTVETWQSVLMSYVLASIATWTSSIIVMTKEFFHCIYLILKIIWVNKKKGKIEAQVALLQDLVVKELVGLLLPLTFVACFSIEYFGPNRDKLGNVGNSYWQYQAVDDFNGYVQPIFYLILIDLCSMLIGSILLWSVCGINLYRAYAALEKEFGRVFMINLAFILSGVSRICLEAH